MTNFMRCPVCQGSGKLSCNDCGGDGKIFWQGVAGKNYPCGTCKGSGKVDCFLCKGTGVFYPPENKKK